MIRALDTAPPPHSGSDMDDNHYVVHVVHTIDGRRLPTCQVLLQGLPVPTLVDTGASINLTAAEGYQRLSKPPPLKPTRVQAYAFGNARPLEMAGVFTAEVAHENTTVLAKIYMSTEGSVFLLGCQTAQEVNLVHFAFSIHASDLEDLVKEFDSLFKGFGCLKGPPLKLHIDDSVAPVALRHRQVAFHLRPKVEQELQLLEKAGIIERVSGPTPWVSPIVVTRKPKQPEAVRICVYPIR
ncbi:hypothetical protein NDU88_006899 [Pleurodeles waltl]|uniref:Uncharacterized protein n=1 Tax=Pleurodeles waltl TaxID=8319 RepID=A0AAV7U1W7_PLEWA|nr:hypothetical protein NDU88_006899 [Pleurodeles waltl]